MKSERVEKRIAAYKQIWAYIGGQSWSSPIDSDRRLAEELSELNNENEINELEDNLTLLRYGKEDPSPKLIAKLRDFFRVYFTEDLIDAHLVTPFLVK